MASLVDVVSGYLRDAGAARLSRPCPSTIRRTALRDADADLPAWLLPVFDWANGAIHTGENVASDLYDFYASGAGASRTLNPQTRNSPSLM